MQTLGQSRATRRSPVTDVAIAVAIGLVAALAKRYLDFSLGIPGHAGVGWIAVLVSSRLITGRIGMGMVTGLSMAAFGVPLGLGHSLGYNALLYGMSGALLDTGVLIRLPLHKAWGATLAGAIIHLAKFGFVFANALLSGVVKNVEVYGFIMSMRNHVFFGALGGLLG
ncbi:hypothetical protein HQ535_02720, partial [bacterium]|nr:hypothetical protein [bacterium]